MGVCGGEGAVDTSTSLLLLGSTIRCSREKAVAIVVVGNTPATLCGAVFDLGAEFLATGEFCYGEGVETVDDVFVGEHDFEDGVELG